MAEKSEVEFNINSMITLYCYVNKNTSKTEAIVAYSILGMTVRRDKQWIQIMRDDADLVKYLNSGEYRTFELDWDLDPLQGADPADEQAWEHTLVQKLDKGEEVTVEDLEKYGKEINIGDIEPRDPSIDSKEA